MLVVTPSYPAPDNHEAAVFVHRQVAELVRQGLRCRVAHFRPAPPTLPQRLVRRNWIRYYWKRLGWSGVLDGVTIDQVFYRKPADPGADVVPVIAEALVDYLSEPDRDSEFDVIYAHWLWTAGAAALELDRRFGLPVVAIARGGDVHEWLDTSAHARDHVEAVLTRADLVLANCEYLRSRLDLFVDGAAARACVVYNGCDAGRFRPAADRAAVRRELRLSPELRYLLFCGSIEERKGLSSLSDAWARFSAARPDWRLLLVGPALDPALARRIRERHGDRVVLTGQVSPRRVAAYYQSADAYVQPSLREGLANATMEAMATGLPVVTTDACGQTELIESGVNGWLVKPGDAADLLDALEAVAADPARAAVLGARARATILERFDPRGQAAGLATRLAEVARARAADAPRGRRP